MEQDRLVRAMIDAISCEELLAKIAHRIAGEVVAVLRATPAISVEGADASSVVGELRIDRERREVEVGGERLRLKPREFALLEVLARRPGRVFSREELLAAAWPDEVALEVDDRTVDVHIRRLRQAIGDHRIRTASGIGYALEDRLT